MNSNPVSKDYKPKWTRWSHETVREIVTAHKRSARRAFKQFLKTQSVRDWDRSQRKIGRRDFD